MKKKRNRRKKKNNILIPIILFLVTLLIIVAIFYIRKSHADKDKTIQTISLNSMNYPLNIEATVSADSIKNNLDVDSENTIEETSNEEEIVSANESPDPWALPLDPKIEGIPEILNNPSGTIIDKDDLDTSNLSSYFVAVEIPDEVFNYINGRSFQENSQISREDLRYIKLLHYNFDHEIQVGELIVNASLAKEMCNIFTELFNNEYEIYSMYLPDRYWTGDGNTTDTESCDANNTSAFFYRVVDGSNKLSNHAMGKAIDINPQQNPYVSYKNGSAECIHENALDYIDRTTGAEHMITESGVCYRLFTVSGYKWGGSWNSIKDYQHFEK